MVLPPLGWNFPIFQEIKSPLEKPFCSFPRSSSVHPTTSLSDLLSSLCFFIKAYLCGYFFICLTSVFLWLSFCWKCNQGSCLKTNIIRPPMPCGKWLWTAEKKYECIAISHFQDKGHLLISPVPETVLRQW